MTEQTTVLSTDGLRAGYGKKEVVFDATLAVNEGEIVLLCGHNGAGKTTTLRTIFGLLPARAGIVRHQGNDITRSTPHRNVAQGIAYVPSERFVFGQLSVLDNLRLRMHSQAEHQRRLERAYELFPILSERSGQLAETLSGGQQRMLSLATALMARPRLLLLDEPSLGLAPALVDSLFQRIRGLAAADGVSVLLVEQNIAEALTIADRAYVMRGGRIILEESAAAMRERAEYWDLF